MTTLREAAIELNKEYSGEISDTVERADRIATELALIRPDTTVTGRQRAAGTATGAGAGALTGADLKEPRPPGRPARAKKATKFARTRGRRLARQSRRANALGLLTTTIGLAVFYNLLRSAGDLAGFLGGLQRAVEWLNDPTKGVGPTP